MRGNESGTAEVSAPLSLMEGQRRFLFREAKKIDRAETLAWLDGLGINYRLATHHAVHTIQAMEELGLEGGEWVVKNLFLRDDKKRQYFLVSLQKDKSANLKTLRALLGSRPLSFASEADLDATLGLAPGAVTPLGGRADARRSVTLVLDEDIRAFPVVGVHPNDNTATVFLTPQDLERAVAAGGSPLIWLTI